MVDHRLSIAPMMDYTDRDYRYLMRLITRRTVLYTEMIHTGAILRGEAARHLDFDPAEKPLVLQVGGDNPTDLSEAVKKASEWPYDEFNLNCGCPSDRVQNGNFGAVLMADPTNTAKLVKAMVHATRQPVSVKHRIGITHRKDYQHLRDFAAALLDAGAARLIVHARIAILEGLSPKENREIPPLQYDWVYRLKQDFPGADIHINGGIRSLQAAGEHLRYVDGAMLGRIAVEEPFMFARADHEIFGDGSIPPAPTAVLEKLASYLEVRLAQGVPARRILRHTLNLFHGLPGSRAYRRYLSEHMHRADAGVGTLRAAARKVLDPDSLAAEVRR